MKINLCCSSDHRKNIEELLKTRDIDIDSDASLCLCARGEPLPQRGVIIVFDAEKSDELMAFLDTCFVQKESFCNESFLPGKTTHGFTLIPVQDISFFEADGNYIYAQVKGKQIEVDKKLYELEEMYQDKGFVRISKSYIINILSVKEIIPWFSGKLILKLSDCEKELNVSRNYVKNFKRFIGIGK